MCTITKCNKTITAYNSCLGTFKVMFAIIFHHICHLLTIFGSMTSELAVLLLLFLCPCGFALVTSIPASFVNVTFSLCWWSPYLLLQVGFWPGRHKTQHEMHGSGQSTWLRHLDTHLIERMCAAHWDNAASSAASCALYCKRLRCCKGSVSVQL